MNPVGLPLGTGLSQFICLCSRVLPFQHVSKLAIPEQDIKAAGCNMGRLRWSSFTSRDWAPIPWGLGICALMRCGCRINSAGRAGPDGGRVEAVVTGDRDPGYGSTSKMIAESASCLVRDVEGEGGIWTPGALLGPALRKRLKERAGLTFSVR